VIEHFGERLVGMFASERHARSVLPDQFALGVGRKLVRVGRDQRVEFGICGSGERKARQQHGGEAGQSHF
jgi:hypothetical protein